MGEVRFTWSKPKPPTGPWRLTWKGRDDLVLRAGGVVVGNVCRYHATGLWYWYGYGHNSLSNDVTYATKDEAKEACLAHAKEKVGK